MKIQIIRNTVAQGRPVFIGEEVVEISTDEARLLIGMGKAVPVVEKAIPAAAVLPPAETAVLPAAKPAPGKSGAPKKGRAKP